MKQFKIANEKGSSFVSLLIVLVSVLGVVSYIATNPTIQEFLNDQTLTDEVAISSLIQNGMKTTSLNEKGEVQLFGVISVQPYFFDPNPLLNEYDDARNILDRNNYAYQDNSCFVVHQLGDGTPRYPDMQVEDTHGGGTCIVTPQINTCRTKCIEQEIAARSNPLVPIRPWWCACFYTDTAVTNSAHVENRLLPTRTDVQIQ